MRGLDQYMDTEGRQTDGQSRFELFALFNNNFANDIFCYWECNFPMSPHVRPLVDWSVGLLVGLSVIISQGRKVTLP